MYFIESKLWIPGDSKWPFWYGENVTLWKVVGDLQRGDKTVTLNHMLNIFLDGGFKHLLFSPLLGEMIQFD